MPQASTLRSPPPQAGQLLRVLGLAFALAVGVGTVIGGGILRTPAVVFDAVPHAGIAIALWLSAAAALGLTLTGQFETVFLIMAALAIVPFLVCDLALFKLRRDAPDLPRPYRAKLYPWLPALALLLDLGMLILFLAADWNSGLFIVAAVAICVPIGLWMRRNQSEPIALG